MTSSAKPTDWSAATDLTSPPAGGACDGFGFGFGDWRNKSKYSPTNSSKPKDKKYKSTTKGNPNTGGISHATGNSNDNKPTKFKDATEEEQYYRDLYNGFYE